MATFTTANVDYVQIDSLVIMKIVKHVDNELYAGMSEVAGESCTGLLTGLVSLEDRKLEVTNCFPTARAEPSLDQEDANGVANQQYEDMKQAEMLDMLRKFRQMNIDYEMVGFYQSHPFGACFTQELTDSLFDYQSSVHDGVVLIYDPVRTRHGQLSIRAYRLAPKALELCQNSDWSPEAVKAAGLSYQSMYEELPIVIKNSHLVNVMLAELAMTPANIPDQYSAHLELGTRRSLEKSVRQMMSTVEELNRAVSAYVKYAGDKQRHDANIYNLTQKRQLENEARVARGEPPLSFDDIKKLHGPHLATRAGLLDAFLASSDIDALADFSSNVTGDNIAKLFLAESLADDKDVKKERASSVLTR